MNIHICLKNNIYHIFNPLFTLRFNLIDIKIVYAAI